MANFKYKVINKDEGIIEGTYAANTREDVMEMIKRNNYYPLKVEEILESKKLQFSIKKRVSTKDIAIFCRQFYTMLNAGLSISNTLSVLSKQLANKKLRADITTVGEDIKKGLTFSAAMKKHETSFPELLINMIEAGELSGNLDIMMKRMSENYEKETKINGKIKGAMIYPIVLGILSIGLIIGLMFFMLPTFLGLYEGSNAPLPAPTKIVINLTKLLKSKSYYLLGGLVGLIVISRTYFKTENGQLMKDKIALSCPIVKILNMKIVVSRFTRTLSILVASGIALTESLSIVGKVINNKIISKKLLQVNENLMKGVVLSESLEKTAILPQMLCSMVKIGEEAGALEDILDKTADFYDNELEAAIETFTAMIQPLMLLVMGGAIGFMIIASILPMFGLFNVIDK